MGQARGTITQEELEKYSGVSIMLMNDTSADGIQSGGTASGSASTTYTYTISWDDNGLIGNGWSAAGLFQSQLEGLSDSTLELLLGQNGAYADQVVGQLEFYNTTSNNPLPANCFTYSKI